MKFSVLLALVLLACAAPPRPTPAVLPKPDPSVLCREAVRQLLSRCGGSSEVPTCKPVQDASAVNGFYCDCNCVSST